MWFLVMILLSRDRVWVEFLLDCLVVDDLGMVVFLGRGLGWLVGWGFVVVGWGCFGFWVGCFDFL